jgi:ABC-type branched-subunit amino acid transport system ATPase component
MVEVAGTRAVLRNRGDQLSGGEQSMLAIGRALLILDEATAGLAPIR